MSKDPTAIFRSRQYTRRVRGWKVCAWTVAKSRKAAEWKSGVRRSFASAGDPCHKLVSPTEIKNNSGIPICPGHREVYREAIAEAVGVRQALRDKYDPGPLPIDENA